MVYRLFVEKKEEFSVEANSVLQDIQTALLITNLKKVRLFNRYDLEDISQEDFEASIPTVLSEPQVDVTYTDIADILQSGRVIASEYLPGQFDQRADSCAQCIQILTQKERPLVKTARVYLLEGDLTDEEYARIREYLINPVESREASLQLPKTLKTNYTIPNKVDTLTGFTKLDKEGLHAFIVQYGLAMDDDDIAFCQKYFKEEEMRDPTITEIKMIDTYWSDHCRHTTFLTNIDHIDIEPDYIKDSFHKYMQIRAKLYANRPDKTITLMDLATIGAKYLKKEGLLEGLDESEEINACSIKIKVDANGEEQDWLLMFKNETHNHPTEIEPFGGAATCLGGAIRDPLSGRSYVFSAMRVTGAGDPRVPVKDTLKGKLPQRKIVTTAAAGYSSYGNQIGLATGHVAEIYHPGYVAKRMEIGAVMGAAPQKNVVRMRPQPSDVVILLGGRTGRDGCGGATGSSKSHTLSSLESCGAEVQKGNAPEERKLQRLFRNPKVTTLIKRCNDFGAGGVSVAIGELADGLNINLNAVPKKYDGLDGTELAISESQERMAVVVAAKDVDAFISYASQENLEASVVAEVTEQKRLVIHWNGINIVDLSREFLNSNGAPKHTNIRVCAPQQEAQTLEYLPHRERFQKVLQDLNVCSQKGLVERFDSTIGANTVLMPFGGIRQLTPTQAMAFKIPMLQGDTTTAAMMAWGFDPYLSERSPYHGAMMAVVESVAKLVAIGADYHDVWLTFQEYFERTKNDPARWGKPFAALLGALESQINLGCAAIGGKDSMSGTFEDIDVPPTLVSFAVATAKTSDILSPEFKQAGHKVALVLPKYNQNGTIDFASVKEVFQTVTQLIRSKKAVSAWALSYGGVCEAVCKMAFGNHIGFAFDHMPQDNVLYKGVYGGFVLELCEEVPGLEILGQTTADGCITLAEEGKLSLDELCALWQSPLESIFPCKAKGESKTVQAFSSPAKAPLISTVKCASPRVLIPVFPGTNCEYDTARAFELAGGKGDIFVIRNLNASQIEESVDEFARRVYSAQIIAIPGGFSGGDEPDGSGKFITAFFRNPKIKEAVRTLLKKNDGLMCGICNGFQALIKLGLVPYGDILEPDENAPTLTFNTIGRHQSMLVRTRVASNQSPWLMHTQVGHIQTVAISHGEGRFVADEALVRTLAQNGQIATQYVDLAGNPTMEMPYNPNGSVLAVEGILSPDGRVFGKMGHSERMGNLVYKNVPGYQNSGIFQSAVGYYKE